MTSEDGRGGARWSSAALNNTILVADATLNFIFNGTVRPEACLDKRRYWCFLLSSICTFLAGLCIVLVWRLFAFLCCRKETEYGPNDPKQKEQKAARQGKQEFEGTFMTEAKDWAGELISGQTTTGRILASFLNKKINIDGKRITLAIWDTAGQEKFHALGPIYYRSSNGAVLVYDITDHDSFEKVKTWVKELRKMLGREVCLAIVGNKIDLEKDRTVAIEEAEEYSSKVGAMHFFTSAKQNQGVEEMFLNLAKKMMERNEEKEANGNLSRQNSLRRNMLVVSDDEPEEATAVSKGCCGSGGA